MTFFGIKPTMTVIELSPGGGWYTEILAPYLRDNGGIVGVIRNFLVGKTTTPQTPDPKNP